MPQLPRRYHLPAAASPPMFGGVGAVDCVETSRHVLAHELAHLNRPDLRGRGRTWRDAIRLRRRVRNCGFWDIIHTIVVYALVVQVIQPFSIVELLAYWLAHFP